MHMVMSIGYTTKARPEADLLVDEAEIKAPSNYKNADAIAEYVARERLRRREAAKTTALLCELDRVVLLDYRGCVVPANLAETTLEAISQQPEIEIAVCGLSLFRYLVMFEQIKRRGSISERQQSFFTSLRSGEPYFTTAEQVRKFYDPVHALLCTTQFDERLDQVAAGLGIKMGVQTATERAHFARQLVILMGRGV